MGSPRRRKSLKIKGLEKDNFFLAHQENPGYFLPMNSMIDPQSEISTLATVTVEEGDPHEYCPLDDANDVDLRDPNDDGSEDETLTPFVHSDESSDDEPFMYPDDGDYDPSSDF